MYRIRGGKYIQWSINIAGSKNAALPLISSAMLVCGKSIFENVPDIHDVHDFIHFYESIWAPVTFRGNTLEIDCSDIKEERINTSQLARTRAWIYCIAWLLTRFWKAHIPFPAGDKIGKRPIDEHIHGYTDMGYEFYEDEGILKFSGDGWQKDVTTHAYFAVTATANLILWAVSRKAITRIELCAFEPHIFNLIDFLRKLWVPIDIRYDHTIIVHGWVSLQKNIQHRVISDYLQSWTFIILGTLASKDYIDIHNARIADLSAFLYKLHEAGGKTEDLWNDTLRVYRSDHFRAVNLQTNIFPGFPTDLMPLFTVLLTQCEWESRIHEILYEWRLNWLVEYERLGNTPRIINPHEAKIQGKSRLHWSRVNSWDLRSWAAMVLAGIIAEGETLVENIYWIKRGYDNLLEKLQSLGVDIEEI